MAGELTSAVVQVFAKDVPKSIAFYRLIGLPFPDPGEPDPHVDVELPGGNWLSIDAEQTITGMHPEWTPPDTAGRVALALRPRLIRRSRRDVRESDGGWPSRATGAV